MLMFPPSLHQNIRELDKQISLLENECENMKSFKEKKVNNGKPPSNKTSKASNSYLKSPPVKETSNKPFVTGPPRSISAGSSRKLTVPPVMSKWSSASSVPCKDRCRRSCSGSVESPVTEIGLQKTKSNRSQTNLRNSEKEKVNLIKGKCVCPCSKPRSVSLADSKQVSKNQNDDLENHLLHKEVLYTNPGSTIEVTVTQKSSKSQNESNGHPPKRSMGLLKEISETISDKSNGCSCGKGDGKEVNRIIENDISSNGQKWCEILSDRDYGKNEKKKNLMGDLNGTKKNNDELLSKLQCYYVKTNSETSSKYIDNNGAIRPRSPNFSSMKENTYVAVSRDCNKCKEQAVQCSLWDLDPVKYDVPLDLYNPIRILHFSLNQLKKKEVDEDTKNLIGEMENAMQKICSERIKPTYNSCFQPSNRIKSDNKDDLTEKENNGYINYLQTNYITAKSLCDKLTAEKEQMSKELADKDRRLADMINDEKKYLSLISSLKNNLEKSKGEAEESVRLVKELNILKNKLFDETKVADALRKSHAKMQERVQKYLLENDKLKTQIRMHKLEARKFDLLLAGKDVEINRYKEEMESFKKMISEELAILRSNAAMNEVEKAMEAIMHHSLFSQTDLESIRSESQIDKKPKSSSTKTREKLMHSSPSSTKASILDSSWNQISSIHGDELPDKDSVILTPLKSPKIKLNLNVSKKSNGFLETGASKRSSEVHQIQKDVLEQKKEPSFTSCKSVIDLDGSEIAQNLDGSESDEDGPTLCHDSGVDTTKNQPQLSLKNTEKIKSNIEDLFNDWRLKLKEKISSAQNNMNFENFFDDCPLSDLSQGSDDLSITLSEIESQTDGRN